VGERAAFRAARDWHELRLLDRRVDSGRLLRRKGLALGTGKQLASTLVAGLVLMFGAWVLWLVLTGARRPIADATKRPPWQRALFASLLLVIVAPLWPHPSLSLLVLPFSVLVVDVPLWVLERRGAVRACYWLARLVSTSTTPQVQPALRAARALVRRPSEVHARFVEEQLASCLELGPTGAAALGFVALSRGERGRAFEIFRGVLSARDTAGSHDTLKIARELCVLEAAARGAWREVSDLSDLRPSSRLTQLLGGMAQMIRREPDAPSKLGSWLRWLLTPHRRTTRAWLRSALASPAPPAAIVPEPSFGAFAALAVGGASALRPETLSAACRSLDLLRASPTFEQQLKARAQALGIEPAAETVRQRLIDDVEDQLVGMVLESRAPAAWLPPGETGIALRTRAREARLERLEDLAVQLEQRTRENTELSEDEEWRTWGEVSLLSDDLLRDAVTSYDYVQIFTALHRPLWSYGYYQGFMRHRRCLARVVFDRQHQLALAAQSTDDYVTIRNNLAGINGEWLPLQTELPKPLFDPAALTRARRRLRVRVVAWLIAGVVGAAVLASMQLGFVAFVLLAGSIAKVAMLGDHFERVVEIYDGEYGVILQTPTKRYVAPRLDVTLSPGTGGALQIALKRAPHWMRRRLWSAAASEAAAAETIERLGETSARWKRSRSPANEGA
jgi:hypothetical protein